MLVEDYLDSLAQPLPKLSKKKRKALVHKAQDITGLLTVRVKRNGKWKYLEVLKKNLLTNAGRDFIHAQVYTNTSAGTRGANYVAVTTNSGAPAAGDTTLTSEITTNGLERAVAGTSHSAGTNTTTLSITYTASGSFTAVQKAATFNASSSGTMMHENTFTSTDLVSADQLSLVWTMTLG
jgi:hypothetical protein